MDRCEIKRAVPGPGQESVWDYPRPPRLDPTSKHVQVFAGGALLVDGELVRPQPGGFYGGWVTDDVVGPFKGSPGSSGW
jgi:hypothetical protein